MLSMQQSVLLCISTILDSGNHYTKMMELVDEFGQKVFETINITLVSTTILCQNVCLTFCLWIVVQVCDDCLKTGAQHSLSLMPYTLSNPCAWQIILKGMHIY